MISAPIGPVEADTSMRTRQSVWKAAQSAFQLIVLQNSTQRNSHAIFESGKQIFESKMRVGE